MIDKSWEYNEKQISASASAVFSHKHRLATDQNFSKLIKLYWKALLKIFINFVSFFH